MNITVVNMTYIRRYNTCNTLTLADYLIAYVTFGADEAVDDIPSMLSTVDEGVDDIPCMLISTADFAGVFDDRKSSYLS